MSYVVAALPPRGASRGRGRRRAEHPRWHASAEDAAAGTLLRPPGVLLLPGPEGFCSTPYSAPTPSSAPRGRAPPLLHSLLRSGGEGGRGTGARALGRSGSRGLGRRPQRSPTTLPAAFPRRVPRIRGGGFFPAFCRRAGKRRTGEIQLPSQFRGKTIEKEEKSPPPERGKTRPRRRAD